MIKYAYRETRVLVTMSVESQTSMVPQLTLNHDKRNGGEQPVYIRIVAFVLCVCLFIYLSIFFLSFLFLEGAEAVEAGTTL